MTPLVIGPDPGFRWKISDQDVPFGATHLK